MIINYNHNQNLNVDQKLQSLIESMQMALDELKLEIAELDKKIKKLEEGAN